MAIEEPDVREWLAEAKKSEHADQCGMFLVHNGVVRITPKAQVRGGEEGLPPVKAVVFSSDAEGVRKAIDATLGMPGIHYVRVWLNEGVCHVGDSLMYVLVGGDIRPHVIDALQALVGKIKNDLVVEKELFEE